MIKSETPRTDSVAACWKNENPNFVPAEFARILEHELTKEKLIADLYRIHFI
jgi:hypothetical protein